jgi:GPH family glycoside/pentoside/hexuronide:cation symporter
MNNIIQETKSIETAVSTDHVPLKEKIAYGLGDTGYNFMFELGQVYLLKFYTDILGLPAATAGLVFLLTKIFDGFTDIGVGTIVDNRRKIGSRGKFRPFILYAAVPLALITIAVFTTPNFTLNGRLIWAILTYMAFTTIYTTSNIPYGAMLPAMTKDPVQRAQLASFRWAGSNFGLLITSVAFIPIVMIFSDLSRGYMIGASIFAVLGVLLNIYAYANIKERHVQPKPKSKKRNSIWKSYGTLFRNKPLIILSILNLLMFSAFNVKLAVQVYFCEYNLNDITIVPYLGFFSIGCVFLGIPLVPVLVRKIGKKGTYITGALIWAVADICAYAIARDSLTFIAFASLAFFGSAFINTLNWVLVSDCVEYGEWKTGERGEGIVYSFYTFSRKMSQALAGFIPGVTLAFVGYIPNVVQSARSLEGIRVLMFIYPATLAIVATIIMYFFYGLNDRRYDFILKELNNRK